MDIEVLAPASFFTIVLSCLNRFT